MIGIGGGIGAAEAPIQSLMDAKAISQSVQDLESAETGMSTIENTITITETVSKDNQKNKCGK